MAVIYKYTLAEPLPLAAHIVELTLPDGAWILKFDNQDNEIRMWAVVDPSAERETRRFLVQGTGHEIAAVSDIEDLLYMDTVKCGPYVWHVFEISPVDL